MTNEELLNALLLLYPSDSDEPFDVFCWPANPHDSSRQQVAAKVGKAKRIDEFSVEDFFGELEQSDDAERFRNLRQILESNFKDLKVYRASTMRIDIYVIGRASSAMDRHSHCVG